MTSIVRLRIAGALALAVALPGCGGSDAPATPTPSPTPVPTPPPQVISYLPDWELPSGFFIVDDFAVPGPGMVTATVDWRSASNNVDVYLTQAPCSIAQFFSGDRKCRIWAKDEKPNAKPAVASVEAGPDHVGGARIFIINKGPGAERGSYIVELERPQ